MVQIHHHFILNTFYLTDLYHQEKVLCCLAPVVNCQEFKQASTTIYCHNVARLRVHANITTASIIPVSCNVFLLSYIVLVLILLSFCNYENSIIFCCYIFLSTGSITCGGCQTSKIWSLCVLHDSRWWWWQINSPSFPFLSIGYMARGVRKYVKFDPKVYWSRMVMVVVLSLPHHHPTCTIFYISIDITYTIKH